MIKLLLILTVAILVPTHAQIQYIELPLVSSQTQNEVTFRINYLKMLLPTYNWLFCNKVMLHKAVQNAAQILHKAAKQMKESPSGNVIIGANNLMAGRGNVVIGSNNKFIGLNSWLFTCNYETPASRYDEGILVVGNYKVLLIKCGLIFSDPRQVISQIDESEIEYLKKENVAISFFFR